MKKRLMSLFMTTAILFSFCLSGLDVLAENSSTDFDSRIEKAEEAKKEAEERVRELEKDIEELENSKGNILKYVEKVDKKIEKVSDTLDDLDDQISNARKELEKLEEEYTIAENVEKEQYETMKKRIKYMYENGSDGYMDVIFSAKSLGDFLNRSEYIEKISKFDSELFTKFVQTKNDTELRRAEMEGKVEEIATLQEEATAEKDALKKLKSSKKSEIGKLNSAISATDKKVKTFNAQVAKQEQKVENLLLEKQKAIEKEEEEKRAAQAKANKSSGGDAAQPATDSYAANTGQLRWPLRVAGRISSRFGSRTSPTEGASAYHRGIDIAVASGTPIVASAAGKVVTATYSSSAGNYVMIYHGNSLYTVYMHASKLAVSEGTEVAQGDVIAYVGSTGVSTGAHLHFGISINGAYVDPLNYVSQ